MYLADVKDFLQLHVYKNCYSDVLSNSVYVPSSQFVSQAC